MTEGHSSRGPLLGSALVAILAIAGFSAGPTFASQQTWNTLRTFSDGLQNETFDLVSCPSTFSSFRSVMEFDVPFDANITYSSLNVALSSSSSTADGWFALDVGDDGSINENHTISFSSNPGFLLDGAAGPIGAYVWSQHAASGNVTVPIRVTACPNDPAFAGSWALTFYNLSVSYSQGDIPNRSPTFAGQIPEMNVSAGGSNRTMVDLRSYFSDPDGDPLTYCGRVARFYETKDSGVRVELSGSLVQLYSDNASWTGDARADFFATDDPLAGCGGAQSNNVTIHVVDGSTGSSRLPQTIAIAPSVDLGNATEGSPLSFSIAASGALPLGTTVIWLLDREEVGRGQELSNLSAAAGSHTLEVRISSGNVTRSVTVEFSVAARPPPLSAPVEGLASAVMKASLLGVVGLGAVVVGTGIGRYRLAWLVLGIMMPRRRRGSLLDHFVRGQIYQIIRDEPGIHFAEIRRRTSVGNGACIYHLHLLEDGGFVRVMVDGVRTRFFPTDQPMDERTYELTQRDREVFDAVEAQPGSTQKELIKRLRRSQSTVSRTVERLARLGYVQLEVTVAGLGVFPRPAADRPAALNVDWPTD